MSQPIISYIAVDFTIAEVCVAWRKGVRRVWGLPSDTHCELLPVICDSIPFFWRRVCRTTNFINCCLNSFSEIVNYVSRHGVFFSRMRSPIGSNALYCCQQYGVRANDITIINSALINRYVRCRYSDELILRASALLELIFIRDHSFNLSGWAIQEINYMLSAIFREWVVFVVHILRLMFFFWFLSLHILCTYICVPFVYE